MVATLLIHALFFFGGYSPTGDPPLKDALRGVKATATSAQVPGLFGPQNLCTDVGLTFRDDGQAQLTTNGYFGKGCMWHSGYTSVGGDENPIVEFDLGRPVTIDQMHIWNQNGSVGRGFRQMAVMVSVDGKDWRTADERVVLAPATGRDDYTGERVRLTTPWHGRYVRFFCEATHRQGGQRELAGLGKVKFFAARSPKSKALANKPANGRFPVGAGVVNLASEPYSADPTGQRDAAPVLEKAFNDWQGSGATLYLPAGDYRLSRPVGLRPGQGWGYTTLRGDGRDRTTLRLADNVLSDPNNPQAVLSFAFKGAPDRSYVHADWFNNNLSDLTINSGRRNPGAKGLEYYSNNVGALRDVKLVSPDRSGLIGLDLGHADQNGPCLVQRIDVDGFATGVRTAATVNSQTAEHVVVTNARQWAWDNAGQCLAIRGLIGTEVGGGFRTKFGVVALVDARFDRGSMGKAQDAAVINGETAFIRDLRQTGFEQTVLNERKDNQASASSNEEFVTEWVSSPITRLASTNKAAGSLRLPIEESPIPDPLQPGEWVNIRAFRRVTDTDDSAALERAARSGAKAIFLPAGGHFFFGAPVDLPPSLERVTGYFAHIGGTERESARWTITKARKKPLVIEQLRGNVTINHQAEGDVVVRDGQGTAGIMQGPGRLFLENVTAHWEFRGGSTWARQLNEETQGLHLANEGGRLWVLGLKTERGGTLVSTSAGGQSEILGGLSYTTTEGKLGPMFVVNNAELSVTMGEVCYTGDPYTVLIEEHQGQRKWIAKRGDLPLRPAFLQGSALPLFRSDGPALKDDGATR